MAACDIFQGSWIHQVTCLMRLTCMLSNENQITQNVIQENFSTQKIISQSIIVNNKVLPSFRGFVLVHLPEKLEELYLNKCFALLFPSASSSLKCARSNHPTTQSKNLFNSLLWVYYFLVYGHQ